MKQNFKAAFFLSLFSLVLAGCAHRDGKQDGPSETRFVVLGDSQLTHQDTFARLVHEVELINPEFVVQVGDMIEGYKYDEDTLREEWAIYGKQIEPLTIPFHPVPGNHDVVTPVMHDLYGEIWGEDRYYYSFDKGPVHGIVLDTYWPGEFQTIGPEQFAWLKKDLEQYAASAGDDLENRAIFVFMHAPLWRYDPLEEPETYQNWLKLHALLMQYPVKLVVGGHTHEYVWQEINGIDYVVINSSGKMAGKEPRAGYMHIMLHVAVESPGAVFKPAVVQAGSVLPLDTVDSRERQENTKLRIGERTLRMETPPGEPLDETMTVELANELDQPRTYELRWQPVRGSAMEIEPRVAWVDVPAEEAREVSFRLRGAEAPGSDDPLPSLQVSSTQELRSGYVTREWEQRYRAEIEEAAGDPEAVLTNVPLDIPVKFASEWNIFIPPKTAAYPREGRIEIDGRLAESAWDDAEPVTDFQVAEGEPAGVDTRVRFLYDADYLYVGARMEEPNPAGMQANAQPPVALTWADDDFELFLDPGMTQDDFYRLFQNYAGVRFSSKPLYTPGNLFEAAYDSAVEVGEDFWSLEMRIPWSDLDVEEAPEPGDRWGLNIWRNRQQSIDRRHQWSLMANFPYEPNKFGVLEFE